MSIQADPGTTGPVVVHDWYTLIAIVLGPVIAVGLTLAFQWWKERRDHKRHLLATIISTRHARVSEESVRALNLIDVVFSRSPKVRQRWREYYDIASVNPYNAALGNSKFLELITAMAEDLGYGNAITHLDADRIYFPTGLGERLRKQEELMDELLQALRTGVKIIPPSMPPGPG